MKDGTSNDVSHARLVFLGLVVATCVSHGGAESITKIPNHFPMKGVMLNVARRAELIRFGSLTGEQ